jgi:hypothetical protein
MKQAMCAAGVVLLLTASGRAQGAKPNFSGTWRLDVAKSDFGPAPAPESIVHVVEHKEPNLKITTTQKGAQGEVTNERALTTDGKENTNKMKTNAGEAEAKSTSQWDGKKLATALSFDMQGTTININDTWELSADAKVLTIVRQIKTPQGDFTQTTVYNKQ